jgi:hypothetical protein
MGASEAVAARAGCREALRVAAEGINTMREETFRQHELPHLGVPTASSREGRAQGMLKTIEIWMQIELAAQIIKVITYH